MASEVRLPRLGQGMESGTILRWLKAEGERVEKGEPLYEVETEKATQEVEAEASGILLRIAVAFGEVPVGQMVAVIGEEGELLDDEVPAPAARNGDAGRPASQASAKKSAGGGLGADFRAAISGARTGGRVKASPLARRMARDAGIDLRTIAGSGPDGRIIAEDVERVSGVPAPMPEPSAKAPSEPQLPPGTPAPEPGPEAAPEPVEPEGTAEPEPEGEPDPPLAAADSTREAEPLVASPEEPSAPAETPPAPAPPEAAPEKRATTAAATVDEDGVESIPLTKMRRTIARRLGAAAALPVFQLTLSVDMTHANGLVARSRELNPGVRVTVTDLLAKVCARALMRHRELNAQFTEDAILLYPSANIGIAVAAPQGLVVPVIAAVERLSLVEVASRREGLVARAREGKLTPDDLGRGTFTISNLGMYGIEQFTAILNPPQAAIVAVGATVERPVVSGGQVVVAPMLTLTLTVDHRAVDGGPAAEFLRTVKTFLEDPALAL